ncbi:MAG TPA: hypothetical protein VKZ50_20705 [bacterium]|nr:hypothetical protein [bacterium]
MRRRWVVALAVVSLLAVSAMPVLAQPGPGWGRPGCPAAGGQGVLGSGQPITMAQAVDAARSAVAATGIQGLAVGEVMEFSNHFYVVVKDGATGAGAFELVVNRFTGFVAPQGGPNVLWNVKYGRTLWSGALGYGPGYGKGRGRASGAWGMYGGAAPVGPGAIGPTTPASVTSAQATALAQQFLASRMTNATVGSTRVFPGYYTIDFTLNGTTAGLLSVNAYSGQVWYHTGHGLFIREAVLR